jgi:hypothetical protein
MTDTEDTQVVEEPDTRLWEFHKVELNYSPAKWNLTNKVTLPVEAQLAGFLQVSAGTGGMENGAVAIFVTPHLSRKQLEEKAAQEAMYAKLNELRAAIESGDNLDRGEAVALLETVGYSEQTAKDIVTAFEQSPEAAADAVEAALDATDGIEDELSAALAALADGQMGDPDVEVELELEDDGADND